MSVLARSPHGAVDPAAAPGRVEPPAPSQPSAEPFGAARTPGQPLAGQPLAGQPLAGQPLAGLPLEVAGPRRRVALAVPKPVRPPAVPIRAVLGDAPANTRRTSGVASTGRRSIAKGIGLCVLLSLGAVSVQQLLFPDRPGSLTRSLWLPEPAASTAAKSPQGADSAAAPVAIPVVASLTRLVPASPTSLGSGASPGGSANGGRANGATVTSAGVLTTVPPRSSSVAAPSSTGAGGGPERSGTGDDGSRSRSSDDPTTSTLDDRGGSPGPSGGPGSSSGGSSGSPGGPGPSAPTGTTVASAPAGHGSGSGSGSTPGGSGTTPGGSGAVDQSAGQGGGKQGTKVEDTVRVPDQTVVTSSSGTGTPGGSGSTSGGSTGGPSGSGSGGSGSGSGGSGSGSGGSGSGHN